MNKEWPLLTCYEGDSLNRVALPVGGIGTGTVSLGGRGDLRDWEIVNRPAKGFQPRYSFFTLYARPERGPAITRALEGKIPFEFYEGPRGARATNHGLPRFRKAQFVAAYPFGQVLLSDQAIPLDVRIEAFNPLIPGDADASGIPIAVLRFVLFNKTSVEVFASICGNIENFIGADGSGGRPEKNVNQFRRGVSLQGIFLKSEGVSPTSEQWGTIALTTSATDGVSYRTCWQKSPGWNTELTDFWDDFGADGELETRESLEVDNPLASLAVSLDVPPHATRAASFFLTWHFPNRMEWKEERNRFNSEPMHIGNYYGIQYSDAWDVAVRTSEALPQLEEQTVKFVRSFCESDLPAVVKEAALYNLSTLRTQTCFRSKDGHLLGWEGCSEQNGCCAGSCTHVWNYEQATAFLFGDLARTMREVEFRYGTNDIGHMSFRINLPLERGTALGVAAADGQMGCLMKLYRDWQLSGDDAFLRALWPKARKALEFCWVKGGWDANQDGVMEGAQHNTMDVEYYGPNPQMGIWYLGALRATEEMARHLGESDFADKCRALFEKGSKWIDENLFNGEYYFHEIRPISDPSSLAPGLVSKHAWHGLRDPANPRFQLGEACLVDQLVGQYMAHICALGYLVDREHIVTTLKSIMKYNFKEDMSAHFNNMRSFVLNGESAILMASYPHGNRPREPFPYYTEVMTGFEYCASVHMLYEGLPEIGLKAIKAIRARYDGEKRNPFDEAECGSHYARAMASWAALLALTGFRYSAVEKTLEFAASDERKQWFWSNGYAWGTFTQNPTRDGSDVELAVLHGDLRIKKLILKGAGTVELRRTKTIKENQTVKFTIK
ncbi:non-lysosomal glucosylceramidase [Acidobacteria bacterium AH-259-O06]|nr:non-lysosomal glucosylceramidase [Acidobacteria bacterium AH-259-O06]